MTEYLYEKIYQIVKDKINRNELTIGDMVPTELELSREFGVSRITSKRALQELEQDGYITRIRGKGSFVKERTTNPFVKRQEIVLVMPFNADHEFGQYARGISDVLDYSPYELAIRISDKFTIEQLEQYQGLIYYPENVKNSLELVYQAQLNQLPVVLLDKDLEMFSYPAVTSDNQGGAYQLTKHLANRGCQKILFVGMESLAEVSSVRDRYFGYLKACSELNLKSYHLESSHERSLDQLIEEIMVEVTDDVSIYCGLVVESDWLAIQIVQQLQALQLSVPDDFAVVGFDDIEASRLIEPHLTTAAQNFYQMGKVAGELILKEMKQEDLKEQHIAIPVELKLRKSSQQ
ncbi:transcriptional regulator, GntR family [Granulicatella balaenopterae]|uniref:Transcriptional regulator, GntR family n=1 Tax=Granulicatella balaenopterae TaxID=137733 RepID=A0A1H9KDW8_9LACT|nr:LacI family DNA-binding transcriptional regulator [Granulicatella balaenopterae]SEQ97268.1 transcriptional regulator, GntR family [Granulicatella balaenopterae]